MTGHGTFQSVVIVILTLSAFVFKSKSMCFCMKGSSSSESNCTWFKQQLAPSKTSLLTTREFVVCRSRHIAHKLGLPFCKLGRYDNSLRSRISCWVCTSAKFKRMSCRETLNFLICCTKRFLQLTKLSFQHSAEYLYHFFYKSIRVTAELSRGLCGRSKCTMPTGQKFAREILNNFDLRVVSMHIRSPSTRSRQTLGI